MPKFLLVERKEREWNWGGVQWNFSLTGEEWMMGTKPSPLWFLPRPMPPHGVYPPIPVQGQCFLPSNLSHLQILLHQYSSQHPTGHLVVPRNILGPPPFSLSKDQKTIAGIESFYHCLGPWQTDVSSHPSPFQACFHLPRPDHVQKLACPASLCRALLSWWKFILGKIA